VTDAWPTLFILGAEKAGTTSLYDYLSQHPEIYFPDEKEPGFFSLTWDRATQPDEVVEARWGPREPLGRSLDEATQAYLDLYAGANQPERGDATASYLWHPDVPERIEARVDDPCVRVLVRNPGERAYSHYLMAHRNGAEPLDFAEALERDLEREANEANPHRYLMSGRYHEQITRYTERFGEDCVHVAFTERMGEHPRAVLEEVCTFLDIATNPVPRIEANRRRNPYREAPNRLAHWLRTSDTIRTIAQRLVPERVRDLLGNQVLLSEGEKPEMGDEARAFLEDYYADEADKIEALTGRPPLWDWA
jgi:hypothetical protein